MAPEQTKELDRWDEVHSFLEKDVMVRAAKVLPASVSQERFHAILVSHFNKTPRLFECTDDSIARAVVQMAELNLEPTGAIGQASIIPYGSEATLVIEYGGYITLAHRSGRVRSIYAREVYDKDHYVVKRGTHESIDHVPYELNPEIENDSRGELLEAYSVIHYTNGGFQFETVDRKQIAAIKAKLGDRVYHKDSPWVVHEASMWCKSAIRKLQKYVPKDIFEKAPLMAEVMRDEDLASGFIKPVQVVDVTPVSGAFRAAPSTDNRGHDDTGFGNGKTEALPEGAEKQPGDAAGEARPVTPQEGGDAPAAAQGAGKPDLFGDIEEPETDPLMEGKNNPTKKRLYYLAKKHEVPTSWIAGLIAKRYDACELAEIPESGGREVCDIIEIRAEMKEKGLSEQIQQAMTQDASEGRTMDVMEANAAELEALKTELKIS